MSVSIFFARLLNIRKVVVSGGCLDHRVDPQVLNAGGGEKAVILALDEAGRVSVSLLFLLSPFQSSAWYFVFTLKCFRR